MTHALLATVGIAALTAVALTRTDTVREVDFIGEVQAVSFGPGWRMTGAVLSGGGRRADAKVGPQTIMLTDGTELRVPPDTPGGNLCLALIHPSQVGDVAGEPSVTDVEEIPKFEGWWDWSMPCVVMGETTETGEVAWFQVLAVVPQNGDLLAEVGSVIGLDFEEGAVYTSDGLRFPLAAKDSDCGEPLNSVALMTALADWTTGEVVALRCHFAA